MTYKLTITQRPEYLHVIVTGLNTRANVMQYLEEIRRECVIRESSRVLIEERLEGPRLGTMDVFKIAAEGSIHARGILKAIAYVDVNAAGDLMTFAETVAINRMLPVRIFLSVRDAEKWLLANAQSGDDGTNPTDAYRPR